MSGGANIRVDATTRGAEAGLDRVRRGFRQVGDEADRAARRSQQVRPPPAGGRSGPGAGQYVGAAGRGLAGPVGQMLGPLGGALGAASLSLGVVGVAALAAGLSLRALAAYSDRAAQVAREGLEIRQQLHRAERASLARADAAGGAAVEGQRATLRALIARGGDAAVAQAQGLTRQGHRGAAEGLLALLERGGDPSRGIAAAASASRTGLMDFGEAARALAGRRLSGDPQADAAGALSAATGRPMSARDVARFQAQFMGGSFQGIRMGAIDQAQGQVSAATLDRGLGSGALQTARLALEAVVDPVASDLRQIRDQMQEQIQALRAAAAASYGAVEGWRSLLFALGLGQGSYMDQADQRARVAAQAGVGN